MFLRQSFQVAVVRTEHGHVSFVPSVCEGDTVEQVVTLCGQRDRQLPYGTAVEPGAYCADCYGPFTKIVEGYNNMMAGYYEPAGKDFDFRA